jgi:hypothetical protein
MEFEKGKKYWIKSISLCLQSLIILYILAKMVHEDNHSLNSDDLPISLNHLFFQLFIHVNVFQNICFLLIHFIGLFLINIHILKIVIYKVSASSTYIFNQQILMSIKKLKI